ncbi:MAG: SDR family oxidoreductase [Nitrospira sp.]|nr:SDR family oxidoreductase [Nitrospira sp.]MDH4304452.1 SDR family oxidoreductase [Nitrospira sp.]MDH5193277.1 SDR family oxidoreductase [Nitrospira sp.]
MTRCALITGAAGLIGHYLVRNGPRWAPGWEVRGLSRADLDLTDQRAVEQVWKVIKPSAVVHCAALSRTKDCERDPQEARRNNVDATVGLACRSEDIPFVFLSSGEVFDGKAGWYRETDDPNPINAYGQTKFEAEQRVLENPRHTVVRIVLTAGTSLNGDRSFVEDMSRAAKSGKAIMLYGDEFRCPLPAGVIARAVWEVVNRGATGLYHLGGRDRLSRWEIGQALLPWYPELRGHLFEGVSSDHAGAPRPPDLSLNCDRLQALLSFSIPGFRAWLQNRMQREGDLWDYESTLA